MVHVSPTQHDYQQSYVYMTERNKLAIFNHFLKIQPHIFSHVALQIQHNKNLNNTLYDLMNSNISVRLIGTRKYCEQINCNMSYPRGKSCTQNDEPIIFKTGNSDVAACHSACYNLFDNNTKENGESSPFTAPMVKYSDNQQACLLYLNDIFSLGADDYRRTNEHTTQRIDTIGTGFDLDEKPYKDIDGNETFRFKVNKYYCDDFGLEFDGGGCKPSIARNISGWFFSELLYKAIQYGVRFFRYGIAANDVNKPDVPPVRESPPPNLENWLRNVDPEAVFIDPDVKLSDLGITGDALHLIFTTEFGWPGRLIEPVLIYQTPKFPTELKQIDYRQRGKDFLPQFAIDDRGQRLIDEFERVEIFQLYSAMSSEQQSPVDNLSENIYNLNQILVKIFTDAAMNQLPTIIMYIYKEILVRLSMKFEKMITSGMMAITEFHLVARITKSLITTHTQRIVSTVIANTAASQTFKAALIGFKVLNKIFLIASIIGLIDFTELFYDFFGSGILMNQDIVDHFSELDLQYKEDVFGYRSFEYSPAFFVAIHDYISAQKQSSTISGKNTETNSNDAANDDNNQFIQQLLNEKLDKAENVCFLTNVHQKTEPFTIAVDQVTHKNDVLRQLTWQSEYLYRLEKNSDGIKINWSEEPGIDDSEFEETFDNIVSNLTDIRQSSLNYSSYISDAMKRFKYGRYGLIILAFMITFCFVVSSIIPLILTLIIAIILYALVFTSISRK